MKSRYIYIFSIIIIFIYCGRTVKISNLHGSYLNQPPPGMRAEVFAPDLISTDMDEAYPCFSKMGNEFYFRSSRYGGFLYTTNESSGWRNPEFIPFSKEFQFGECSVSYNGSSILFCTNKKYKNDHSENDYDIWIMNKIDNEWMTPLPLSNLVNSNHDDSYPVFDRLGNLYFFSDRDSLTGCDIYLSKKKNGEFTAPFKLPQAINTEKHECDPFLSPDGSYLIYCRRDGNDGLGENDLYVNFRMGDGSWSNSINLGNSINTVAEEITPYISSDNKYLFFASNRSGNYDIYWVKTKIIEDFRPSKRK